MKVFGLGWALLNGYGQIVNGALIRANRLAFGWAEGYLCIGAASGQMANQASVSYQTRIVSVSIPYRSPIVLLSFSYHSRFQKRKQYGNNTETTQGRYMLEGRTIRDGYMVGTWRKLCLPFPTKLYFSSMRKSETGEIVT